VKCGKSEIKRQLNGLNESNKGKLNDFHNDRWRQRLECSEIAKKFIITVKSRQMSTVANEPN